jgi:hypothetical protein
LYGDDRRSVLTVTVTNSWPYIHIYKNKKQIPKRQEILKIQYIRLVLNHLYSVFSRCLVFSEFVFYFFLNCLLVMVFGLYVFIFMQLSVHHLTNSIVKYLHAIKLNLWGKIKLLLCSLVVPVIISLRVVGYGNTRTIYSDSWSFFRSCTTVMVLFSSMMSFAALHPDCSDKESPLLDKTTNHMQMNNLQH